MRDAADRRGLVGDGGDLHPPRRRRPDRDVEHVRDDPDRGVLRHRAAASGHLLRRRRRDLRRSWGAVTGSSWTTAGTLGVAFVGHGPDPRCVDDDRRRRRRLRGLHGRQDVAAVGDDGARAEPRRRRHRPASTSGECCGRSSRRSVWQSSSTSCSASSRSLRHGALETDDGPASAGRRLQHLAGRSAAAGAAGRAQRCSKVPPFLAIFGTAVFSGVLACFTQPDAVDALRRRARPGRRARTASRRSTSRWPTASCRRAATRRSTTSSPAAGWRACSPRSG